MKTEKIKSIPLRMCVVCKEMIPKRDMLRVVKNNNNEIFIDETGKANGRGAYVCKKNSCVEICFKKKQLNKVFKTEISDEVYAKLMERYSDINN